MSSVAFEGIAADALGIQQAFFNTLWCSRKFACWGFSDVRGSERTNDLFGGARGLSRWHDPLRKNVWRGDPL